MPKEIAQDAREILIRQKDPSILVVEKLQQTQQKLNENLKETESLKENTEEIKREYEENLNTVKKEKKKTIKNIKTKFDYELLSVKAEIKDILDELRREKSEKIARRSYARLAKLEENFRRKIDEYEDKNTYAPVDFSKVKPGDKLILKEIHQSVTVLSEPDKHGKIYVQMGNIKTKIDKEKLAPYDKAFDKKSESYKPASFEKFELRKVTLSNRLDLRGKRVEDALDELEIYLDQASLASPCSGYGDTRAWHRGVKICCQRFHINKPLCSGFRPGKDGEGGDGVSVLHIK